MDYSDDPYDIMSIWKYLPHQTQGLEFFMPSGSLDTRLYSSLINPGGEFQVPDSLGPISMSLEYGWRHCSRISTLVENIWPSSKEMGDDSVTTSLEALNISQNCFYPISPIAHTIIIGPLTYLTGALGSASSGDNGFS